MPLLTSTRVIRVDSDRNTRCSSDTGKWLESENRNSSEAFDYPGNPGCGREQCLYNHHSPLNDREVVFVIRLGQWDCHMATCPHMTRGRLHTIGIRKMGSGIQPKTKLSITRCGWLSVSSSLPASRSPNSTDLPLSISARNFAAIGGGPRAYSKKAGTAHQAQ